MTPPPPEMLCNLKITMEKNTVVACHHLLPSLPTSFLPSGAGDPGPGSRSGRDLHVTLRHRPDLTRHQTGAHAR